MIYLVDLEYVESRYTSQWKTEFPALFKWHGLDVKVIEGPADIAACTTPGAFLNFSGTNVYKAEQVKRIANLFTSNDIKDGDQFVFADAWHPGVINLKYMAELLGIKIKIHGLWHAGSYDSQDFLGRLIGNAGWVRHAEKSMFECYDYNWFASDFHIDLFIEEMLDTDKRTGRIRYMDTAKGKISKTGWPMDYLHNEISCDKVGTNKDDIILFPHRIAPEKQPEIFEDLANELPEYKFIFCQKMNLSKKEYHALLGKAKMVFSANTQETLGIGCFEALCANAIPLVPDRLSYTEMYYSEFKYDSEWTESMDSYMKHKEKLISRIRNLMSNYSTDAVQSVINTNREFLECDYFSAESLVEKIKEVM